MLGQRLLVAAIGIPLLAVALIAGQQWIVLLIAALVVAASVEAAGLLDKAGYPVQPAIAGGLGLLMAAGVAFAKTYPGTLPAAWMAAFVVAALVAVLRREPEEGLRRFAGTVLVAAFAAALSMLISITVSGRPEGVINPNLYGFDVGRQLLLLVVLTVWAYDTAAYAVGRFFPRGHFFAHISPKKTWSGALGGLVGAALAGWALGVVIGRPVAGLGLGILVGLIAPVGDLAESMLKRAAGVKDSSRVLPGHGGLLDRMDSFLTVAPAAFLYLMLVGLVA
jgi:phosphatidate cytidylyltransferase